MSDLASPTRPTVVEPPGTATPLLWLAALALPVGPLAIGLCRLVLPYDTNDSGTTAVEKMAAHPGSEQLAVWLAVVAGFTLIPGVLAALRLSAARAPRLTAAAGVLTIGGYLALYGVCVMDFIGRTATPGTASSVGAVVDKVNALPEIILLTVVFVIGHVIGTILLAVALWRAGVLGTPVAVLLGVSQLIHFVASMAGNHPIDLLGWGLTAVAMGFVAVALLRSHGGVDRTSLTA